MEERQALQMQAYLEQLKGAKIITAGVADGGEDGYIPFILVEMVNGEKRNLFIYSDGEGNGPGYIDGLPRPTTIESEAKLAEKKRRRAEG